MALFRLLEQLPRAVEVITDHEIADPNPLRGYLKCLADPPKGATHMAILQDDCLPCDNFDITLRERIAERPVDVISLFVGDLGGIVRKHFLRALAKREPWCELPIAAKVFHVVGLVWPVQAAADFLAWYREAHDRIPAKRPHRSDDMVFSYWIKNGRPRRRVWATVPCLVEHPDDVPSVAQLRRGGDGTDKGRRAISFAGR